MTLSQQPTVSSSCEGLVGGTKEMRTALSLSHFASMSLSLLHQLILSNLPLKLFTSPTSFSVVYYHVFHSKSVRWHAPRPITLPLHRAQNRRCIEIAHIVPTHVRFLISKLFETHGNVLLAWLLFVRARYAWLWTIVRALGRSAKYCMAC